MQTGLSSETTHSQNFHEKSFSSVFLLCFSFPPKDLIHNSHWKLSYLTDTDHHLITAVWLGSVCLCGWNVVRAILIFGNYDTETPACTEKKEKHPSQNCHRKPADFTSFCKPVCSQWIINQHNPSQDVHFSLCILFLPLENMLIKLSCAFPPGVCDATRCPVSVC